MQRIMFTKHLQGLDIDELIAGLQSVGVVGADLCVRPGYPVTPENIEQTLPDVAERFADAGLGIPLVTLPTDMNVPDERVESVYSACAAAGVRFVKIGYWRWSAGEEYWRRVDECRKLLEGFAELSRRHHVKSVVHTHSGRYMGLNASAVMQLVSGFDPEQVGVFADTGHLSICGEPVDMALEIVADYLAVVAFKDLASQRVVRNGQTDWVATVRRMGEGFVDWRGVLQALDRAEFDGPVCFHSEYNEPSDTVIDLARCDVRFIDGLLAEPRA